MSFINYLSREINCKIVYYGPGLCGKTTNLQYIYNRTNPDAKGKMIALATEPERTLFFDVLPLEIDSRIDQGIGHISDQIHDQARDAPRVHVGAVQFLDHGG